MTRRQAEGAIAISDGACNPRGVARTLVESIDEDTKNGGYENPAIYSAATRLMLDQLFYIMFGRQLYNTTQGFPSGADWLDDREACRQVRDAEPVE